MASILGEIVPTQETRLGRMLTAGRVTATITSKRTGQHITLTLKSMVKDGRWKKVPLADATHVFIAVGDGTIGTDKVGTYYPKTGKFYTDRHADPARIYAAEKILLSAQTGVLETATYMIQESSRCGACGRELTDPVSIERGIGPECYGRQTGSQHQVKEQSVSVPETPAFEQTPIPAPQLVIVQEQPQARAKRDVPSSFEELRARMRN